MQRKEATTLPGGERRRFGCRLGAVVLALMRGHASGRPEPEQQDREAFAKHDHHLRPPVWSSSKVIPIAASSEARASH